MRSNNFEWDEEILDSICWKATWEMVCFCSERQVAEWQYIVVHTMFAFVSQFSAFPQSFFLLISTLSSVCFYLAVFSISAFWSVFTFIFAFSCWAFLTQFTIAYHIKTLPLLFAHVYNATVQGYNCTDSLWIIWMSVQNCPHGMIQGPIKNWSNIDNLIRCAKTC